MATQLLAAFVSCSDNNIMSLWDKVGGQSAQVYLKIAVKLVCRYDHMSCYCICRWCNTSKTYWVT